MAVVRVTNLTKIFHSGFWPFTKQRSYTAVNDISFEIKQGEILGLLGPNGAGKTTIIQMLLGTLTPSKGSIEYFGRDFTTHRITMLKKIGYASGYDKLPARLTIAENLDIIGRIYGMNRQQRSHHIKRLLKFFGMWELRDRQTGTLSAGQATRSMLAKAFLANPTIVLLDEPTASLDPNIAHEVRQFILAQRAEHGTALLITSHNMDEVTKLCDRVLVLKQGSLIANNTPGQLAQLVSKVRIHLIITAGLDRIVNYIDNAHFSYTVHDNQLTIELDEQAIAQFLADISERKIMYSQISIDKPTLEDYFLSIAQ